jgi:hypothetical protein
MAAHSGMESLGYAESRNTAAPRTDRRLPANGSCERRDFEAAHGGKPVGVGVGVGGGGGCFNSY